MFLVIFLDASRYEFVTSLHSNLAAAEAAYEALLRSLSSRTARLCPRRPLGSALRRLR